MSTQPEDRSVPESTGKQWRKGCLIGCGVVIALGILLMAGGSLFVLRPFRGAIETREALDAQFGELADFTPAADGAVPADRMETFLEVRRRLMEQCGRFQAFEGAMEGLEELDDLEDPPRMEILGAFWRVTRQVFGLGTGMREFFRARNEALQEAGMGRGEYTYIYVLAYSHFLRPSPAGDREAPRPLHVSARARKALRSMLRNQLAGLESLPVEGGTSEAFQTRQHHIQALRIEIQALEEDPERLPWQNRLPAAVMASVAPYRDRLDSLFCVETVQFEFIRNRRFGPGIRGD